MKQGEHVIADKMGPEDWPENYDELLAGEGCRRCLELESRKNAFFLNFWEGEFSDFHLDRRATRSLRGYSTAVWRRGHVTEPTEADEASLIGFWNEVGALTRAIRRTYEPVKLNVLSMGTLTPHLHVYIYPRYDDDPAPGRPLPWSSLYSDDDNPSIQELVADAMLLRGALQHAGLVETQDTRGLGWEPEWTAFADSTVRR